MWTNWEKACSRVSADGKAYCQIDAEKRVVPSEPFCSGFRSASGNYRHDATQQRAYLRFCQKTFVQEFRDAVGVLERRISCSTYERNRPFNGFRLAARRHPLCQEWRDADTAQFVCSEVSGDGETGSCAALASSSYVHPRPLYCSRWSEQRACRPYDGYAPNRPVPPDGIYIPGRRKNDSSPVFFPQCVGELSDAR